MKNPLYRSISYFIVRKFASKINIGANLVWLHLFSAINLNFPSGTQECLSFPRELHLPQWGMPYSSSPMGHTIHSSIGKHHTSLRFLCDQSHGGRTGSLIVAPGLGKLIFALRV
jgi:hypothetical protein